MNTAILVILVHQLLFQAIFFGKNIYLKKKLGRPVRGHNSEATLAIAYFSVFILCAIVQATGASPGSTSLLLGLLLMALSLGVAAASLYDLGDSWRVGVIENQSTQLVETGIYRFSRNPYFLSYLLLFAAYSIYLHSYLLAIMSLPGFVLIHRMVLKEEQHLALAHGDEYRRYRERVPRYLLL